MSAPHTASLDCNDLDAALEWFTGEGGLDVDTIFPADAPRRAMLSGPGLRLRLRAAHRGPAKTAAADLVVTRMDASAFRAGRAGMLYRDLVPGRFGGRFIASHIRIPEGGPVPDYVHHHDIAFQVIICVRGWVEVVYEDQGGPMRLEAGDCFLQPPHIRHRVLECSDNMEVVEIASPAEHETTVDHDISLPTGRVDRDRDFGGQRFVFHRASEAPWLPADLPGMAYRDTGIAAATRGAASVIALRSAGRASTIPLRHDGAFRFVFITAGRAELDGRSLGVADTVAVPGGVDANLSTASRNFEAIEVSVPSLSRGPRER